MMSCIRTTLTLDPDIAAKVKKTAEKTSQAVQANHRHRFAHRARRSPKAASGEAVSHQRSRGRNRPSASGYPTQASEPARSLQAGCLCTYHCVRVDASRGEQRYDFSSVASISDRGIGWGDRPYRRRRSSKTRLAQRARCKEPHRRMC